MKALIFKLFIMGSALVFAGNAMAQEDWPKQMAAADGSTIKVYQPEPESFSGNTLRFRSAISVQNGSSDPVFGAFWSTAKVATDRDNRTVNIESLNVTDMKIPAINDQNRIDAIKSTLEQQMPQATQIPLDEILTTLDQNQEQAKLSNDISNKAPRVSFTTQPSILVLIDGNPKLQHNNDWNVDVVVNTPFTIIKNTDGNFYLYGGHHWYTAPSATGPYAFAGNNVPSNLGSIEATLTRNAQANNANAAQQQGSNGSAPAAQTGTDEEVSNIVVSTTPVELIQTKGEPNFLPIDGTSLLYVKNSNNDIFMDVPSQQYFVLISGRWYKTKKLNSDSWQFVAADRLPADFAKIPEGSPKDNVLASVAGTDAAREAVLDAQIPQTAKVDRQTATTTVNYDGAPQFRSIDGTRLQYAVNTSSTVLKYKGEFYAVDNGVWFISDSPTGPWSVSTERPDDVDAIPPDYPVYNTKYVYVYDATPDYVYMGYTPGYLNSYIYGPTVVYGTGFYYDPWWGGYYYPRPWSWGFNFGYNPWYGWSFGFGYGFGWFNTGWGYGWGGWRGGWWGPGIYHPAYYGFRGGFRNYGFYGRGSVIANSRVNFNYNNNIYRNRTGVATRSGAITSNGAGGTPLFNRPNSGNAGRPEPNNGLNRGNGNMGTNGYRGNNVFSDRQGNVYQRGGQGWQQRNNRQWSPASNSQITRNLDREAQMRDRGQTRAQNFQRANSGAGAAFRSAPSGGGQRSAPSGGGGARSGGGGGGGGRRR